MSGQEEPRAEGETFETFDIAQIMEAIPHRYPLLLVDRMVEVVLGERAIGIKNVTVNEPFFQGHFPGRPVMPGVLMLEALAQSSALLSFDLFDMSLAPDAVFYFVGIDNARFTRPVGPGDQLILHATLERVRGGIYRFNPGRRKMHDTLRADQQRTLCPQGHNDLARTQFDQPARRFFCRLERVDCHTAERP